MKKSIIIAALLGIALYGCKKDDEYPSEVRTVSAPTITFTGGRYYSINTGGTLPQIAATAYDSFLNESYPVTIEGTEVLDNTTPGLYIISAAATNRNTYTTTENIYVAVTDIPASVDLSGTYKRTDVATGDVSNVEQLARGLYQLDNLGGVARTAANASLIFPVLFVQQNDTTLLFPRQATAAGTVAVRDEFGRANQAIIRRSTGDTSYRYAITSPSNVFGGAIRTFRKQ